MNHLSGLFINLQQVNTAGPGSVYHPHSVIFVPENSRIQSIWVILVVVRNTTICVFFQRCVFILIFCHIGLVNVVLIKSRVDQIALPFKRSFRTLRSSISKGRSIKCRTGTEVHIIQPLLLAVFNIRCPQPHAAISVCSYYTAVFTGKGKRSFLQIINLAIYRIGRIIAVGCNKRIPIDHVIPGTKIL